MNNDKYTVKEILFGLRDECLKLQEHLKEADACFDYDREKYNIDLNLYKYAFKNKYEPWFTATKIESEEIKRLKQFFRIKTKTGRATISSINRYELLTYDNVFPATVKEEMQGKLEDVVDFVENYDYLEVLNKGSEFKLPLDFLADSMFALNDTLGNVFYSATDDRFLFESSTDEHLTRNRVDDILNQEYKKIYFTDRAQKVIEQSKNAKKEIVLKPESFKKEETFSIHENQKTLILVRDRKTLF